MKCLVLLITIFLTQTFCYPPQQEWKNYKTLYRKTYTNLEEPKRLKIFQENIKKIDEHNERYNRGEVSYKMAVNQFADLTQEEFSTQMNRYKFNNNTAVATKIVFDEVPDQIDWREKGAVTEVKNQGVCGACWAFSVTGALEAQNFLKTGRLISLSEQELVDCIIARNVRGCNGGFVEQAYKYVIDHGLSSEDVYPYEAEDGLCHRESIPSSVTENGYSIIFGNEEALKEAVGTIGSISIRVDSSPWQFYSEGIYTNPDCKKDPNLLNHAVLAVGYGVEDGMEYWLVKNSYGPEWGEKGYIRLARNADNTCGIASTPSYPIL